MAKLIKIKRGLDQKRLEYVPELGELIWTTDLKELWVGDGNTLGGIKVTGKIEAGYIPRSEKGLPDGVATLDASGQIPVSQIPAIALSEVYVVSSESEMVSLTAQEGDVAIRTDISKSFIKGNTNSGTVADWIELATPVDMVQSVNGKTGTVVLSFGDLSDVNLSGIQDTDLAQWDANIGKWVPVAVDNIGRKEFIRLDDTPIDYVNSDGYFLKVDEANNRVVFSDVIDGGSYTGAPEPVPGSSPLAGSSIRTRRRVIRI